MKDQCFFETALTFDSIKNRNLIKILLGFLDIIAVRQPSERVRAGTTGVGEATVRAPHVPPCCLY